jgi:putative membrane protein
MTHHHTKAYIPLLLILILLIYGILFSLYHKYLSHGNKIYFLISLTILFILLFPAYNSLWFPDYPASLHMIQHITLLLIVPPIILSAVPEKIFEKTIKNKFIKTGVLFFKRPLIAYSIGMSTVWLLHISMFSAQHQHAHPIQDKIFLNMISYSPKMGFEFLIQLTAGIIYSLPVFIPVQSLKLPSLQRVLYLFFSCLGCSILGIFISMNGNFLYLTNPADPDISFDMQLAGLIMWVPGCILYVSKSMIILSDFFRIKTTKENRLINGE